MFMNPTVRRAFVLLSGLPTTGVWVHCVRQEPRLAGGLLPIHEKREMKFESVSLERNRVQLMEIAKHTASEQFGNRFHFIPLLDVVDVWESGPGVWSIAVRGHFAPPLEGGAIEYKPAQWGA